MAMPGRGYFVENPYRYGFNGKEIDNELKGTANSLDFGARIYDPRVGRWLSTDPLQAKYPGETPYLYSGGNPILFIDPDGQDRIVSYWAITKDGNKVLIVKATYKSVYGKVSYGSGINTKYYRTDIEQNVVIDMQNNGKYNTVDPPKNIPVSEISLANYIGLTDMFENMYKSGNAQSSEKGSYQDAGFVLSGGSGTTLDLKDKAGHVYGQLDIGSLLGYASALSSDISPLFESMDGNALQKVLTELKQLKALKELKENDEATLKKLEQLLMEKQKEIPANSAEAADKKPYAGYKKGSILHTNTGNVRVDTDSTGTCCQDDKKASDTLPGAKKKN